MDKPNDVSARAWEFACLLWWAQNYGANTFPGVEALTAQLQKRAVESTLDMDEVLVLARAFDAATKDLRVLMHEARFYCMGTDCTSKAVMAKMAALIDEYKPDNPDPETPEKA